MGRCSSLCEDFVRVKTPMGLGPFEVRFFVKIKFTKTDLALEVVIKNLSKLVWGLSVMFSRISLNNFLVVKSLMGTPLDGKFFTHNLFFQFLDWPQGGTHIKNWFTTIKDLSIWFFANKGIFVSQNSYGYTSSFSRFFLCLYVWIWTLLKIDYKWGSHWLGHIKHWLVSKVLLARSPPGGLGGAGAPPMCRPPSFLVKLKWSEVKWSEAI